MPFNRPTLADIESDLQADIQSRVEGTDPRLRRSFLGALARGIAGAIHLLFGFLAWIARQVFPDTAEAAELERWARIWGITRTPAARASGTITVTGTASATIATGAVWRSGGRLDYRSTADATIPPAGSVAVMVESVEAADDANAAAGVLVNLVSPIAGVNTQATVVSLTGGSDVESDAGLRARLLARLREPPRGGTAADYRLWALSGHADVTRAFVQPLASGLGTVTVYPMTDDATANGIPAAGVVNAVQDYIDARRPVTAAVTVAAPTAVALNVTISSLMPSTQAVQDAIEAEIQDLILRESSVAGTIRVSHIREAISTAQGETDHVLDAPTADVTVNAGEISVPGTVTFS